jgi:excisionase family DNA binding protein
MSNIAADSQIPQAITVAEFCRAYSVSNTTFYALRNWGDIKTLKVGRRTLIDRDEAQRWLKSL